MATVGVKGLTTVKTTKQCHFSSLPLRYCATHMSYSDR